MLVIGIAGGIASGKTIVAKQLESLGAVVLDADRIAHKVLEESEVRRQIRDRWGDAVFDADGCVDRAAIARIVFAPSSDGPPELETLENITHPRIRTLLEGKMIELAAGNTAVAVLDAPVMFKSGWDDFCDRIIYVEASLEARLSRALERGWTEEEFTRREAAQQSLDVKRDRADIVLDGSGSTEALEAQVNQFWHTIVPAT